MALLALVEYLRRHFPGPRVLILTVISNPQVLASASDNSGFFDRYYSWLLGLNAAVAVSLLALVGNWLRHVNDVAQKHERYLGAVVNEQRRSERLVELNVIEQVANVCQTTIVQDAWERGQDVTVHGWVYGIQDGKLQELGMSVTGAAELAPRVAASLARYDTAPAA